MTDWSDPNADPLQDVRDWMMATRGEVRARPAYSYVLTDEGRLLHLGDGFFGDEEVYPPTCTCDMNLCTCVTPDPGHTRAELLHSSWAAMVGTVGAGLKAAMTTYEEAARALSRVFGNLGNAVAETTKTLQSAGVLSDPEETDRRKLGLAGPPVPPTPVLPMRSVHVPKAYNRAGRGPR